MGLFDFLKKRELEQIHILTNALEEYKAISDIDAAIQKRKEDLDLYIKSRESELAEKTQKVTSEISQKQNELDHYVKKKEGELEYKLSSLNQQLLESSNQLEATKSDYKSARELYTKLRKEINLFENKLDLIEYGVYEPVYDFEKSDQYRVEQYGIVSQQKVMIDKDLAALCSANWTVEGSEAKGKTVVKRYKKLMLRAFNGECDALIAKVKWNNINPMKDRILSIYKAVNQLGDGFKVSISPQYLELKQKELILEYEFQLKKQQEKEKMRAIQEELREEEKAKREFEKAQREAEKEEAYFQKALEKAQKELGVVSADKQAELNIKIHNLQLELELALEKKERALSMAQQTKRGHVYIISNIGAFGENVYKIGMTRRLEPQDRVRELGDASVPFLFDTHAMIYSDEARTLEYELHKAFADRKLNMLNHRREFFRVTLDEIEEKIKELGFEAEFSKLPEAMEYRETLAIMEKMNHPIVITPMEEIIEQEFPELL